MDCLSPMVVETLTLTCSILMPSEVWKLLKVQGEACMVPVPEALYCCKLQLQKKTNCNFQQSLGAMDFNGICYQGKPIQKKPIYVFNMPIRKQTDIVTKQLCVATACMEI